MELEKTLEENEAFYKKYFNPSDELVNICYSPSFENILLHAMKNLNYYFI